MKSVCVIDRTNIKLHPPVLSLLNYLHDYKVTVVSSEYDTDIVNRYPDYYFVGVSKKKSYNKFFSILDFRKRCKNALQNNYDLIWIATGDTALWLSDILNKKKYVLNLFELYDKHPLYLWGIKNVVKKAQKIVVPEYNRAHIIRTWFCLKETPFVIPNKFSDKKLSPRMDLDGIDYKIPLNSKIIIYQGIASKERNLEALCEAIQKLPNYKLVMMCKKSNYLVELMQKYDFIIHQPFVAPPSHLAITSYAYIGIVTYDHYSLNTIFCAPNKIWEYASLGLPMLANSIPGLEETVGKYHAGLCVEMNSVNEILQGIKSISDNYEFYVRGANELFESINIKEKYKALISFFLDE